MGQRLHQMTWKRNFEEMVMDMPDCKGLRYIPETKVKELGIQLLGYSGHNLLIRNDYISAFNNLVSMSEKGIGGGVVVTGQPGIGKTLLLYTFFTLLISARDPIRQILLHFLCPSASFM